MKLFYSLLLFFFLFLISSCRGDIDEIVPPSITPVAPPEVPKGPIKGFFLLNEANMGGNKSSIDYFDFSLGTYFRNIYPTINPGSTLYLGDVGNDIQVYGNKLYAVINCSHYVEVMNLETGQHEGSITIPNCRYVVFNQGHAYVSSYNGPVQITPNAPLGCVTKIDTTNLSIVERCMVGYQPEEMVIRNNKLYVANSGGYRVPNYDNTVSVIDLETFKEEKKIEVGINLHRLELDNLGNIYASSRGDYFHVSSKLFIIDKEDKVSKTLNIACSNMTSSGDSIYLYSTEWSHIMGKNTITYGIIDTHTQTLVNKNFITDGTEKYITMPYGLAIHPETKDIYVTDAKNYVSSGTLYCFSPDGKKKWEVITGEIPAHIVFTDKKLKTVDLLLEKDKKKVGINRF